MAPSCFIKVEVFSNISEFTKIKVEPVGKKFESFHTSHLNDSSDQSLDDSSLDELLEEEQVEENSAYLRKLDPKEWKNQDHYAVLGLKSKRFLARDDDIKRAYRRKVLRHHPDKRRHAGEDIIDLDHDYFSCITKAYEILGNPTKRQSYDSVDPVFDDHVPPVTDYSKENFFETFGHVFEANSRWSQKKHVPSLGNENSSVEEVDKFYSFWYNFDSWREFSYLDEEEKEKGESREERRWIEKQNKVARVKRKKDEMIRIREIVDNAYACDPRIAKFKEEEKERKITQKKAKKEAIRLKQEEEERRKLELLEAAKLQKEKEEEEAKEKREKEKREKELLKKQLKKERKLFLQLCEQNNYFASDERTKVNHLKEADRLCQLISLDRFQNLNSSLQSEDNNNKKSLFLEEVKLLNKQIEVEKDEVIASSRRSSNVDDKSKSQKMWSQDDLKLLVKGVNLFPAGTSNRWDVIVAFISQHSTSSISRTAKEVLAKAKELQKKSGGLREEVNKNAYEMLEKNQKPIAVTVQDQSAPTERFDSPAELQNSNSNAWTTDEQQLLEQALKTYPANAEERWEKIAMCVPGRDKKDCIKRYKELVEMVKAKKAAQLSVKKSKQ